MEIGKILQRLIKQKGLTQSKLAEEIGKTPTALSQIINGKYHPNPETLDKICKVLEVPPAIVYFLSISENDIPEEKRALYKMIGPSLKSFIIQIFGEEYADLKDELEAPQES